MTTFHDPQPQSRRAARQSERERASDDQPTVDGFTTFPLREASDKSETEPKNEAEPDRRDSDGDVGTASSPADAIVERSAAALSSMPPAPVASRPFTDPAYRAAPPPSPQTQHSDVAPPAPVAPPLAPTATAAPEATLTRRQLRELRAREEAGTAAAAPVAHAEPQFAEPEAVAPLTMDPEVLVYLEPPALIDPLSVVPEAASLKAPREDALSAFESLLANVDGSAKDSAANDAPRSPLLDAPGDAVSAEPEVQPESGFASSEPASASTEPEPEPEPEPETPRESEPKKFDTAEHSTIEGLLGFDREGPIAAEPPEVASAPTNLSNARAEFDELARKRLDGELLAPDGLPEALVSPSHIDSASISLAPTGHWSRQAAVEDGSSDSVISRTVSSGTSATSALVLSAIPFATDIRGPLNSNGETMLTGSIDLPNMLSASGVSDRFDHADIDSLLDLNDSDIVSTDSAPVRAVKAVSTFSNQAVTQTQKPKGTRALTVLLISASSMAVVVAGLLVAAFAFNML